MRLRNFVLASALILVGIGISIFYFSHPGKITNYPSRGTDIVAFGDSLVEGVGATAGHDFVSLLEERIGQPIMNLGHSGDTTADGLLRIHELDDYHPKVVLLLLGGNDHLRQIPSTETFQNLEALIENIHARGSIVLLLGVRGGLLGDPFDAKFEELQATYRTAFVPNVLRGLFGDAHYMADTIHPNDAGYAVIADRVYPVLAGLVQGE